MMPTLLEQKCVPCEGGVTPLKRAELKEYLAAVPGWNVIKNDTAIERDFAFKNFKTAMDFVNQVAVLAETEGHHPDITLHDWKFVRLTLWTHAIGGLFINDFILAAKIDTLKFDKLPSGAQQ